MLTPKQIGIIAELTKKALDDNPLDGVTADKSYWKDQERVAVPEGRMEDWEQQLKRSVDEHPELDCYDVVMRDPISDHLLVYYSED